MNRLSAEKALATARTRLLAEQLPQPERDELLAEWGKMLDDCGYARSVGAEELILLDYRERVEARLASKLVHLPLEFTRPPEPDCCCGDGCSTCRRSSPRGGPWRH